MTHIMSALFQQNTQDRILPGIIFPWCKAQCIFDPTTVFTIPTLFNRVQSLVFFFLLLCWFLGEREVLALRLFKNMLLVSSTALHFLKIKERNVGRLSDLFCQRRSLWQLSTSLKVNPQICALTYHTLSKKKKFLYGLIVQLLSHVFIRDADSFVSICVIFICGGSDQNLINSASDQTKPFSGWHLIGLFSYIFSMFFFAICLKIGISWNQIVSKLGCEKLHKNTFMSLPPV